MSISEKYIPKVGNTVLSDAGNECIVLHVGEKSLFVKWGDGEEFSADFDYFRPIPTKADVEREQLISIIKSNRYMQARFMAPEIQNAGFTIQKKVKRSEIRARLCESLESLHFISVETATDEMVNFLGDLVENDQ